ncbi:hypothetical protein ABK040_015492 [Willaertia magna]
MDSCVKKRVFKEQPLVFHNIPSYVFPIIMVVGSILTISISYITSYSLGHTPSFPYTDITHTGRYIPERYFFRFVKINFPLGNIIEWTATLLILIYNITYAIDWKMANNYTTVTEYEEIEYEECQ